MYNQNIFLLIGFLFASSVLAIETGYAVGRRARALINLASESHVAAIQAAILGLLALLLGFTFSLALQRHDSRSEAVVDEANAIGTAYLRAQLLPPSIRNEVRTLLRSYLDGRIRESTVPLSNRAERQALLAQANLDQATLWRYAVQASEEDGSPVTAGLFIESLNELIDSFGRRNAALDRHVPEVVMLLLYATFLMTWCIVGYASGIAGHRPSVIAYVMLALILIVIFIIIDLDRPRRGLVEISHESLATLQATIDSEEPASSADVLDTAAVRPEYLTALEAVFAAPSEAGFGGTVFHEPLAAADDLEQRALAKYRYFVGDLWERYGEEAWMGSWREVYARPAGARRDIATELRGITGPDSENAAPLILAIVEHAETRAALAAAYDDRAVSELRVYNLGDGQTLSGLLVAGRRAAAGEATFVVLYPVSTP